MANSKCKCTQYQSKYSPNWFKGSLALDQFLLFDRDVHSFYFVSCSGGRDKHHIFEVGTTSGLNIPLSFL